MKKLLAVVAAALALASPASAHPPWSSHDDSLRHVADGLVSHNRALVRSHCLAPEEYRAYAVASHQRPLLALVVRERERHSNVHAAIRSGRYCGPWDLLADCENGGGYRRSEYGPMWSLLTTRNGFWFDLQFVESTWNGHRGELPRVSFFAARGRPPTRRQQIAVGRNVRDSAGWGAWPVCSRKVGLR